jgi:hypothetical protein
MGERKMIMDELIETKHKLDIAWKQLHEYTRILQQQDFEITLHTNSHLVQCILFNPATSPSVEAKKSTIVSL